MDKASQEMQESDVAELPPEATKAVLPLSEAGKKPSGVKQPPCPGTPGTCHSDVPPTADLVVPASQKPPVKIPSRLLRRGKCLINNWQEERATDDLDYVPGHQLGYESYTYRHGHRGLLTHELPSSFPISTTMDAYRPPQMDVLPGRGQRGSVLESMLSQKYRNEILEEMSPKQMPMESVSTTHRDYCPRNQQLTPLPTIQRHIYYNEQPSSFWLDQACRLPDVTSIRSGKSPFRRNAAFSTPITEYLGLSPHSAPPSSQFQPHKQ